MTVATTLAGPWAAAGRSAPVATATVGPGGSADGAVADAVAAAGAAAAAAGVESPRAPWRDLWKVVRTRWMSSSDASSAMHATAAVGRGSGSRLGRRPCTAPQTMDTARDRMGGAGGRNIADSGRAHAARMLLVVPGLVLLAVSGQKTQDVLVENLTPSPSHFELFGAGGAGRRLEWVHCGRKSGRGRGRERVWEGAAVEAVVDPSCWGRAAPAAQNFGWPRRWRIIRALRVSFVPFSAAAYFFFVSSSQDSICVAERGVAPVLAQGARQDSGRTKSSSTGVVIACGIRTGQPGYGGWAGPLPGTLERCAVAELYWRDTGRWRTGRSIGQGQGGCGFDATRLHKFAPGFPMRGSRDDFSGLRCRDGREKCRGAGAKRSEDRHKPSRTIDVKCRCAMY